MRSREPDLLPEVASFVERPRLVRWLNDGSTFALTRFVALRLLGLVYFVAFASAYAQAPALIGEHGLLPMHGHVVFPSLFQLSSSDALLRTVCVGGAVLALGVLGGVTNAVVMIVLWALQLSLANAGRIFWGYGWEIQLCETGLIAAFACPMRTLGPFASTPPQAPIWLFRWLVVRVMLGAGLIKLRGDPCWRDLTCLVFHYETQPNPSPVSWLVHQAPAPFHVAGVLFNHFVELVAPFLVLGPRAARRTAGVLFVVFQLTLIVSGNLAFLNWLTIVPALACLDDDFLRRLVPSRLARAARGALAVAPSRLHVRATHAFAFVVGILSVGPTLNLLSDRQRMNASFDPLHVVNTYGAFGSISRVRHEVVLEGTRDEKLGDGTTWEEYELPCKPGDVMRRPCLITPWHYRLDWQMWFASQSSYDEEPWILPLADALLRGDPAVAPLLARNPFGDRPPRWVRASLYRYEFTRLGEGGAWWRRTRVGEYLPPLSRDDPTLHDLVEAARAE